MDNIPVWDFGDNIDHLDTMTFEEVLTRAAKAWQENRKSNNELIGENRGQQEAAFRDYIVTEKSQKIGNPEKWFWVTVNPRKDVTLPQLIAHNHRMYKKAWIKQYMYVYENTKGGHIHSHGLIKATYEPARARKELANSVKGICDVTNTHCFKFVQLIEENAAQKISYMLGKKKDAKQEDVEFTRKWREEEMLKDLYENEELPILLVPREP